MLEIGPGLGILTRFLAERVALVHAVEIDRSLEPHLPASDNVRLHWGDALALDLAALEPAPRKLVANLPYNVATPIVAESLDGLPRIESWCVMVQREVADRFFAQPRTKAYGAVSVLVQLATERTGWQPVSREVFRPRPNVDSALVAFRRTQLPDELAGRQARRRSGVRPSPEDAPELARALSGVALARARGRRAAGARARPRRRAPRRSSRRSSSCSRRRSHDARVGEREDQSRARRRPASATTATTRSRRCCSASISRTASRSSPLPTSRVTGFPDDTLVRSALELLERGDGRVTGTRASRSGSRSPRVSAAAAPTPPRRSRSRTSTLPQPLPRERLHALAAQLGSDVPFFLTDGPQLATGTGTDLEPLDLPQDFWIVLVLPRDEQKRSTADVYDAFDSGAGFEERRDELLAALDAVRRPADLAALPPNDLASSPLAAELLAAGAFRADVSGAGPAVYGLFVHERDATSAAHRLRSSGRVWITAPAWYG